MKENGNHKIVFGLVILLNFFILFSYFAMRKEVKGEHSTLFQDAFFIGIQVAVSVILSIFFLLSAENQEKSANNINSILSKAFLLSAGLVLLIGFGLCVSK